MLLKEKVVAGVKSSGASTALVSTLQLVQLALLARLLAPAEFGLMGMANVVIGCANLIADLGIGTAIIHRQKITNESLSALYWLNLLSGIAVFFTIRALTPFIINVYGEPRLGDVILLLSFLFLIVPIGQQFQVLLEKVLEFRRLAKIEIRATVVGVIVAVAIGLARSDVLALIGGTLAGAGAKAAMLAAIGWKEWRPSLRCRWQDLKGFIAFGLHHSGQRAVNFITGNVDFFLIGSLLGAHALGYYHVAYNLATLPATKINAILARVFFPVFALVQDDIRTVKSGYLQMQEFTSLINIPILLGMAVVAPVAIPLFFGVSWTPSILLLQILVVVGLSRAIGGTVGSLLLARGKPELGFQWSILIVCLQAPGIYAGLVFGGTVGAAIAFAVLSCIYLVLNYVVLIRNLLGPCRRDYVMTIWPYIWMSGIMAAVMIGISAGLSHLSRPFLLIFHLAAGISVYSMLLWHNKKPLLLDATRLVSV